MDDCRKAGIRGGPQTARKGFHVHLALGTKKFFATKFSRRVIYTTFYEDYLKYYCTYITYIFFPNLKKLVSWQNSWRCDAILLFLEASRDACDDPKFDFSERPSQELGMEIFAKPTRRSLPTATATTNSICLIFGVA